ncbi:MAG: GTP-binding protein, partial [Verrucomicrobiae bacterium]|nr:GTP-binding protein [Verrucomicrobiae bacterium]
EEDIEPVTHSELCARIEQTLESMNRLIGTAAEGRVLRTGVRAAIVGRPNVGKSSLLNRLLGQDRAITSPVPGTTRDTIAETANIRGIPVTLIDTAGLRETSDSIESQGVARTRAAVAASDFILQVLDSSQPLTREDELYLGEFAGRQRILVYNKCDLPPRLHLVPPANTPTVRVSCLTGEGLDELRDAIRSVVFVGNCSSGTAEVMINSRHEAALKRAYRAASTALQNLRENTGTELVAMDLRIAIDALGEVVGKNFTEDILDAIFARFCIGK